MKRSRLWVALLTVALSVISFEAAATIITVARAEPGVLPVLVTVGKSGKVTKVLTAEGLKPSLDRLLRKNIEEMIVGPASSSGRAISSQVVMRMRLAVSRREDGDYDAKFVAIESLPVPVGNWFWAVGEGRYALADYLPNQRFRVPSGMNHHGNDLNSSTMSHMPASPTTTSASGAATQAPAKP